MLAQIHRLLSVVDDGITFEQFFMQLIDGTPVTRGMVEAALLKLSTQKEVQIPGEDGGPSTGREHLKPEHILRMPTQGAFSLSFGD